MAIIFINVFIVFIWLILLRPIDKGKNHFLVSLYSIGQRISLLLFIVNRHLPQFQVLTQNLLQFHDPLHFHNIKIPFSIFILTLLNDFWYLQTLPLILNYWIL